MYPVERKFIMNGVICTDLVRQDIPQNNVSVILESDDHVGMYLKNRLRSTLIDISPKYPTESTQSRYDEAICSGDVIDVGKLFRLVNGFNTTLHPLSHSIYSVMYDLEFSTVDTICKLRYRISNYT